MGARPLVDPSGIAHTSSTLALLFRLLLPLFSVTCRQQTVITASLLSTCHRKCVIHVLFFKKMSGLLGMTHLPTQCLRSPITFLLSHLFCGS